MNRRKFAVGIAVLGIILLICVFGFVSWLAWGSHTPGKTKQSVNQNTNTSGKLATQLKINQWGVSLPLTNQIAGAYYTIKKANPNVAYLSVGALKGTNCSAEGVSEGMIVRYDDHTTDPASGQPDIEIYGTDVKVGGYYYAYLPPQAACSSDAATQALATNVAISFAAAAKSIH